jgi:hypothetical protein
VSEPFYFPSPDLFANRFAWEAYTKYAADLEEAGLADRFPLEDDLRFITIELLANRYRIEDVVEQPHLIDTAIQDATELLEERSV